MRQPSADRGKDKDAAIDSRGNFSADELNAIITSVKDGDAWDKTYPSYLFDFISAYLQSSGDETFLPENMLAAYYYDYAMNCDNQFVSSWFEFNLNVNNLLSALTARKYKIEVAPNIVGNTEVSEAIRTSNARDFGISGTLEYFEQLLRISETDELVDRERKIDLLKWSRATRPSVFPPRGLEMELDGGCRVLQLFHGGTYIRLSAPAGDD